MAQPTSSRNRSSRRSSRPVTRGSNPQRANRQSTSSAQVTNSGGGTRGSARVTNGAQRTSNGSARVTGGERPALPPGRRGGDMTVRQQAQRQLPGTNPNQRRLPGTAGGADTVRGSGVRTGQPGAPRRALPPAGSTTSARAASPASQAAAPSRASRALRSLTGTRARAIGTGTAVAGSMLSGDAKGAAITAGTYAAGRALQAIPNPAAKIAGKALEFAAPLAPGAVNALSSGSSTSTPARKPSGSRSKADTVGASGARVKPNLAATGRYVPGSQQVAFKSETPQQRNTNRVTSSSSSTSTSSSRSQSSAPARSAPARSAPAPKPQPQQKAAAQSYRDAQDTKGLSVGRYRTLAEHRAAVEAGKKPAPNEANTTPSAAEQKILDRLKILKDKEKKK